MTPHEEKRLHESRYIHKCMQTSMHLPYFVGATFVMERGSVVQSFSNRWQERRHCRDSASSKRRNGWLRYLRDEMCLRWLSPREMRDRGVLRWEMDTQKPAAAETRHGNRRPAECGFVKAEAALWKFFIVAGKSPKSHGCVNIIWWGIHVGRVIRSQMPACWDGCRFYQIDGGVTVVLCILIIHWGQSLIPSSPLFEIRNASHFFLPSLDTSKSFQVGMHLCFRVRRPVSSLSSADPEISCLLIKGHWFTKKRIISVAKLFSYFSQFLTNVSTFQFQKRYYS